MINLFLVPLLITSILNLIITLSIDVDDNDDINRIKTGGIVGLYIIALTVGMLLNLAALFTL